MEWKDYEGWSVCWMGNCRLGTFEEQGQWIASVLLDGTTIYDFLFRETGFPTNDAAKERLETWWEEERQSAETGT